MNFVTLIIAEYRVRCLITTQIEVVNLDGLTACLLDVHRDFSLDSTTQVVTTKHLAEVTVGDVQRDVSIHVGLVGTRKQQVNLLARLTAQVNIHITVDVRILTGTDNFLYFQIATVPRVCGGFRIGCLVDRTLDGTSRVTTTVCLVNQSALHQGVGITRTVSRRAMVKCTDVGTRIFYTRCNVVFTITATKQVAYLISALDIYVCLWHSGSITTSIDGLDTC